ncbi:MAG: substrate-binding domain-containing protein [candidate division KSB1 bacterium]|nr:substrate-binding domain-containing protein [candidate division KSB1 bacterium]MDZ7301252.1 substrate-binding domain-containing protein [candidate division KSB1 bacterium]MDZ7310524.1 substrate-binding domain-containing protein [candidate division KSB1 bacterium]
MKKIIVGFLVIAGLSGACLPCFAQDARLEIAVIPKGTTHLFWKSVEAGARLAGKDLGVEIIWKGPLKENDRAQQIAIVEQFVTEGVSGIVLAPLDDTALKRPVSAAAQKKIPVVIFDSGLKGEPGKDFISYVATNNKMGGSIAGEHLAKLLAGKGKVVLLRYQVGSASTTEREAGFLETLRRNQEMQVIVDNRYGGATAGEAKTASMNLLDKIKEADGIFCPNESTTFGMLLALRQTKLAGKIRFVGFDTSPPLIEALQKGEIDALVAQNPTRMGYEGVKTLVDHLRGKQVPTVVDTGVRLITRENLNDPEIKKLLGSL